MMDALKMLKIDASAQTDEMKELKNLKEAKDMEETMGIELHLMTANRDTLKTSLANTTLELSNLKDAYAALRKERQPSSALVRRSEEGATRPRHPQAFVRRW